MPDLPLVGEDFGNYRLGPRLGRGGMSVVFQAENWRLGNVVALKILAPDLANDDNFRTRFLQESRIAAGFNHPHVVPIIDSGAYDGLLYIAMRYVAGTDLRQMIAEHGRLAPGTAVHLLSQAALALDAAHRRGLVHRDVKPGNLLIERTSDEADPDHLYLADFGITKYVGGPSRFGGLTTAGTIMGTALYLAPEQAQELAVGGAADQYALGCVLYECLTGRAPFEKSSGQATLIAHVEEPPPPATMFRPDLPPGIDVVFGRVLAKHPGQRFPDCRAFMAAASDALLAPGLAAGLAPGRPSGSGRSPEFRPAPVASTPVAPVPVQPVPVPSVPVPSAGFTGTVRDPTEREYLATEDLPGTRGAYFAGDRNGAGSPPVADEWSFYTADGGDGGGPPRTRRVRGYRESRTRLAAIGLAVLAVVGAGVWVLVAQPFKANSPKAPLVARPAAVSRPAGQLFSVLKRTATFVPKGDLTMSACQQHSPTDVECTNPSAVIKSVSFVTYPTLGALYKHYMDIVANLTGREPFAATVQNKGECTATAPTPPPGSTVPTDENTWNHSDGAPTAYTAGQMATGTVPTDIAMGRVFCEQMPNGSEYIVWTADSGKFLGYATGAASHEQVYQWWYYVHHQIIFPGDTGMSRTMPMSPPATTPPATAPPATTPPASRSSAPLPAPPNVRAVPTAALATSSVPGGRPGPAGPRLGGRR
jgi:serine/threonine-protein kinase